MDVGTLIISGFEKKLIIDVVKKVIVSQHNRSDRVMNPVEDYEAGLAFNQILRSVMSYTPYINRTVWSKND